MHHVQAIRIAMSTSPVTHKMCHSNRVGKVQTGHPMPACMRGWLYFLNFLEDFRSYDRLIILARIHKLLNHERIECGSTIFGGPRPVAIEI